MDPPVSRKPAKATEAEKKQRQRKKKTKQTLTCAVTHIRLIEANAGKLEALDQLVVKYLAITQQYVTLFCTEVEPSRYAEPVVETALSDRWHRVAIQQAAGIARSWRANRQAAYDAHVEDLAEYAEVKASALAEVTPLATSHKEPKWHEWNLPELRVPCIQANANVVVLEPSEDSTFDYWLRISTLDKGHRQTWQSSSYGQGCLLLAGVCALPLRGSGQSTGPKDLRLCRLWVSRSCRPQRLGQSGSSIWRPRTGSVQEQGGDQSPAEETA
jgi:hypothetical protein